MAPRLVALALAALAAAAAAAAAASAATAVRADVCAQLSADEVKAKAVRCDRDSLVFCDARQSPPVALRRYRCAFGCYADARPSAVIDYCKSRSAQAVNTALRSERGGQWVLAGPAHDAGKTKADVEDPCDGSLYAETPKNIKNGKNSDDLILSGYSWDGNVPRSTVHGITVKTLARTTVSHGAACYPMSLELKSNGITSANRAFDGAEERGNWTAQTYGGRFDPWDTFDSGSLFATKSFWVELDEEALGDGADGYARCAVDCAVVTVYYDEPLPVGSQPIEFVESGPAGTAWRYYYQTTPPANGNPLAIDYDDSSWNTGFGSFGYGDGNEHTYLNPVSRKHKPLTAYFRTTFDVDNVDCFRRLKVYARVDDGAIFWLNGQPLWWLNMEPEEHPTWASRAKRLAYDEEKFKTGLVPDTVLLLNGTNHLAVEVHQFAPDSSDLQFDMSLFAYDTCNDRQVPVTLPTPARSACKPGTERCECDLDARCADGLHCSASDLCVRLGDADPHGSGARPAPGGTRGSDCATCTAVCGEVDNILTCPPLCSTPVQCVHKLDHANCPLGAERCPCMDGQKCAESYLYCLSDVCVREHGSGGGRGSSALGATPGSGGGGGTTPPPSPGGAHAPAAAPGAGDTGGTNWPLVVVLVLLALLIAGGVVAWFVRRRRNGGRGGAGGRGGGGLSWDRLGGEDVVTLDESEEMEKPPGH